MFGANLDLQEKCLQINPLKVFEYEELISAR